jgi:predicted regulator of Ras-like GTPase activity (Roadblock/LC7/MglB family)
VSDQADNLAARLAPYRETPGVIAALLISHDGFIVAADAEAGFDADAVAAQVAGAIDMGSRLAGELGQTAAKYISLEFDEVNVVLAPFGDELMLALVGASSTLICEYRLNNAAIV